MEASVAYFQREAEFRDMHGPWAYSIQEVVNLANNLRCGQYRFAIVFGAGVEEGKTKGFGGSTSHMLWIEALCMRRRHSGDDFRQ